MPRRHHRHGFHRSPLNLHGWSTHNLSAAWRSDHQRFLDMWRLTIVQILVLLLLDDHGRFWALAVTVPPIFRTVNLSFVPRRRHWRRTRHIQFIPKPPRRRGFIKKLRLGQHHASILRTQLRHRRSSSLMRNWSTRSPTREILSTVPPALCRFVTSFGRPFQLAHLMVEVLGGVRGPAEGAVVALGSFRGEMIAERVVQQGYLRVFNRPAYQILQIPLKVIQTGVRCFAARRDLGLENTVVLRTWRSQSFDFCLRFALSGPTENKPGLIFVGLNFNLDLKKK